MTHPLYLLLYQLRDADRNRRSHAALALERLADPAGLPPLLDALVNEPDSFVREDITWAVVVYGEAAAAPLAGLLAAVSAQVRHTAAHALGKLAVPAAAEPLMAVLGDASPEVVGKAAFALGQIGDARALPALAARLGHPHAEVRTALSAALARFGPAARPYLLAGLNHAEWPAREHAADTLALLADPETVRPLALRLHDSAWQVRFAALTALSHLECVDASPYAAPLRHDADPRVRALARRLA
jgi:HEAT repeat protein